MQFNGRILEVSTCQARGIIQRIENVFERPSHRPVWKYFNDFSPGAILALALLLNSITYKGA